ncbi:MAG: M20/M25/M40 family metallo-hydrolase [Thermoproteus sp.]
MELKELLLRALSIYSPSHGEEELAKFLLGVVKERADDAWIDEAGNVIAIRGRGGPVVWLHAHMDTVVGMLEVKEEGGLVRGRGAVDDKGPLVAYLEAFRTAEPAGTLVLALVTAEEDDSAGTEALLRGGPPRPDYIYVGEPTDLHVAYAYRGGGKVELRISTRGGHASSPIYGNPFEELYGAYLELKRRVGHGERFADFTATPTVVRCGDAPNKVPVECSAVVDVRIPLGHNCAELEERMRGLPARLLTCTDPAEVDPTNPAARALVRGLLKAGVEPKLSRKYGTSDFNLLIALTKNMAAFGPGDPRLAHTEDEAVRVEDIVKAAAALKYAVEELGKRR